MKAHCVHCVALLLSVLLLISGPIARSERGSSGSCVHPCLVMRHEGVLPKEIDDDSLIVLDYGSFVLARLSAGTIERLKEAGESVELIDASPLLNVAGFSFDPLDGLPELPEGLELEAEVREAPQYAVVQWIAPIHQEFITSVEALGAKCVQYIPDYAMLVRLGTAQLESVSAAEFVRSVTPFEPAFKVERALRKPIGPQVLRIFLDRVPDIDPVLEQLRTFGEVTSGPISTASRVILHLRCDTTYVPDIAAIPEVLVVGLYTLPEKEDGVQDQIMAMRLAGDGLPMPGYREFLEEMGVTGDGVAVAVCDTGLDTGTDLESMHLDLRGRVHNIIDYAGNGGRDSDGHGTHCAGIVAGNNGSEVVDNSGFEVGLGVAPEALIIAQNYLAIYDDYPMTRVLGDAYSSGAAVHSNSWGEGYYADRGYTSFCIEWDIAALDVKPSEPGTQRLIIVKSAGNDGDWGLSSPGEAKNTIAVGATQNYRPEKGCSYINSLASFSSRGPCEDGRVKPDLCAPGECIVSALSSRADAGWCEGSFGAQHEYCSGTSMSCPAAAGAAALIVQKVRDDTGADPSPALVRAWMIATATDMPAPTSSAVPNPDEGWGRIDLEAMLDPDRKRVFWDEEVEFTSTGEEHVVTVSRASQDEPFKAVLSWSDPAGSLHAQPALVNDLDLVVTGFDGTEYFGNHFVGGFSEPGGAPDRLNNVECVFIESAQTQYRLTVIAHQITSDAVPASSGIQQPFALFIDNALELSSAGWVSFSEKAYRCDSQVEVVLADLDLREAESAMMWAVSSSDMTSWLELPLWPDPAHRGFFTGTLDLAPFGTKSQGTLRVQHGDLIGGLYLDADDGMGGLDVQKWCYAHIDCKGPELTAFEIVQQKPNEVNCSIETDEKCSVEIEYWDAARSPSVASSEGALNTSHEIVLKGLYPCSTYWLKIVLTDAYGNESVWDNDGQFYAFDSAYYGSLTYTGGEVGSEDGWHSEVISGDVWHRSSRRAYSGESSWYCGSEIVGKYGDGWRSDLVSNQFVVGPDAKLEFACLYETEGGYDYLRAYVRQGSSEIPLTTLSFSGSSGGWRKFEQPLTPLEGATVSVVFRFTSDSYTTREGCYIDECCVVAQQDCSSGILQMDKAGYMCTDTVRVDLLDSDLGQNPSLAEQVAVEITHLPSGNRMDLTLTEVAESASRFCGQFSLGPGALEVSHGDSLCCAYIDPFPSATPSVMTMAFAYIDCEAPVVTKLEAGCLSPDEGLIRFTTDTPSRALVTFFGDEDTTVAQDSEVVATSHEVQIFGLQGCRPYLYYVELWDAVGNYRLLDNDGERYRFDTPNNRLLVEDDCESGEGEWTHSASYGQDQWHLSTRRHLSGTHSWFCGAEEGDHADSMQCVLQLELQQYPPLPILSFSTYYELESGYDYGKVETFNPASSTWETVRSFNGFSGGWQEISVRLPRYGGSSSIRFRMTTDSYTSYEGWYIDDIRLEGLWDCRSGTLNLDKSHVGCTETELEIEVTDMDLNVNPEVLETVNVTVSSDQTGDVESCTLREADLDSASFKGVIRITDRDEPAGPDSIRVTDDDTLLITYLDEQYGPDRTPTTVFQNAYTDCTRPQVSSFNVAPFGALHALASWVVSRPVHSTLYYESIDTGARNEIAISGPKEHFSTIAGGFQPCEDYHFSLEVVDVVGNLTVVDSDSPEYYYMPGHPWTEYSTEFANAGDDWSHTSLKDVYRPKQDVWERDSSEGANGEPGFYTAQISAEAEGVDAVVVSPPIWASRAMTISFHEKHSSSTPDLSIEASAFPGAEWVDITPVDMGASSANEWRPMAAAFATNAEKCRFRFRVRTDSEAPASSVSVDAFQVSCDNGCEPRIVLFGPSREIRVNYTLKISVRVTPGAATTQRFFTAGLTSSDGLSLYYPSWLPSTTYVPIASSDGPLTMDILHIELTTLAIAKSLEGHWFAESLLYDYAQSAIDGPVQKGFQIVAQRDFPPCASLGASPAMAAVGEPVFFDASGSSDDVTPSESLLFRWDLEADGTWDSDFSLSSALELSFEQTVVFEVAVEVMDSAGQTDQATQGIYVF